MSDAQLLAHASAVAPSVPAMTDLPDASDGAPAAAVALPASTPQRLSLLERLARAAVDEKDSEELRLRKTLLMLASGLMNMAAIVWLAIYWIMGLKLPTTIPLLYQALSAIILA
ncbi:MAG TPA: hypothetical protein VMH26_06030, partial [Burkholderiales bacterium]|nr:hypothetical protein [Burkholderiales bacterium]